MSSWRVLPLDNASNHHVPQLLIKSMFSPDQYTVFITDLSNIWSEVLDLDGILERASQQESPIEVSKHDTTQLAILLENVAKSLTHGDDTLCRITRDDAEGVILHTSIRLPDPLDSLHWRFRLEKQAGARLKNELILPLLVSAHIQHERVRNLIAIVQDKDRAITRLVDHYESSHLDLASAFPSIGGSKPGRKIVKREQAAKHIPALRNFEEDQWKKGTSQLQNGEVCELGLFQEALSECNPEVPSHMIEGSCGDPWWNSIRSTVEVSTSFSRPKKLAASSHEKHSGKVEADETETETETEDEFETHENFKLRETSRNAPKTQSASTPQGNMVAESNDETTEQEDEDDDLDGPLPKQSLNEIVSPVRTSAQNLPSRTRSNEPIPSSSPSTSSAKPQPSIISRSKGFKIGGAKSVKTDAGIQADANTIGDQIHPIATAAKPPKKGFAIGGKRKAGSDSREPGMTWKSLPMEEEANESSRAIVEQEVPQQYTPPATKKAVLVEDEEPEETAEEKADRKRRELKRKNEELAKKQAQKKKKRF